MPIAIPKMPCLCAGSQPRSSSRDRLLPAQRRTGERLQLVAPTGHSRSPHDITPVRSLPVRCDYIIDGSEAMFDVTTAIRGTSDAAREDAHPDITLDHGLNLLCLNCHHRSNNDVTSITTAKIPAEEPTRLCAKCHGPTFATPWAFTAEKRLLECRPGRTGKAGCIQCHDPHRPRFQPIKPNPPPVLVRFDSYPQGKHADEP